MAVEIRAAVRTAGGRRLLLTPAGQSWEPIAISDGADVIVGETPQSAGYDLWRGGKLFPLPGVTEPFPGTTGICGSGGHVAAALSKGASPAVVWMLAGGGWKLVPPCRPFRLTRRQVVITAVNDRGQAAANTPGGGRAFLLTGVHPQ